MDYLDFVKKNASQEVINRGLRIFQQNRVSLIDTKSNDVVLGFVVVGDTDKYYVELDRTNNSKNGHTITCTCPYSYSYHGLCKHQVAVLYFVSSMNTEKLPELKKRSSSALYDYSDIDKFDINSLDSLISLNRSPTHFQIEEFKPDECSFYVKMNTNLWYDQSKSESVTFIIKNNKLKSSCTCNKIVHGICPHESIVLERIKKIQPDFFQNYLSSKMYNSQLEKFAHKNKLNADTIADKVKLTLTEKGVTFNSLDNTKIMDEEMMKSFGNIYSTKYLNKIQKSLEPVLEDNKRAIGAVITGNKFVNFFAVSAKANKTGEELSSSFEILYKSDDKDLLCNPVLEINDFISQSKLLYYLLNESSQNPEQIFPIYEILFSMLNNFKLVYIDFSGERYSTGHSYYRQMDYSTSQKIVKHMLTKVNVKQERLRLKYKLCADDDFLTLTPYIYCNDGFEKAIDDVENLCNYLFLDINNLYCFQSLDEYHSFEEAKKVGLMKTSKQNLQTFFQNIIVPLSEKTKIDFSDYPNFSVSKIQPILRNVYLSDTEGFVLFSPEVVYENEIVVNPLNYGDTLSIDKSGMITSIERDADYENSFVDLLKEIQPFWQDQAGMGAFYIPIKLMMDKLWFLNAYEKLVKNDVNVLGLANLKHFKYKPYKASVTTNISSGQDWFDINIEVRFGDFIVKLSDVIKAIKNKNSYILLSDGSYGILPEEWIEKFERYLRAGELSKDGFRISKLKFHFVEKLFESIDNEEIIAEITQKKLKLSAFKEIKDTKLPAGIKATLRDYQKEGLNWLNFLHEFGWGGILADDMGLGKTLQVISFFKQIEKESKLPHLIVVPTSLIFNWESEFKKFAPGTEVFFHYGPNRDKDIKLLKKQNIIITSYGTLTSDLEIFVKIKFNYIVLDESQAIKNPTSLRYKTVCSLKAENRIACTGTPIENNTFDLYAQFNFLNPGFFGSQNNFRDEYSTPIDKNKDIAVAKELQELVNPFVLRRTKEQVITELPPKTEDILYCNMEQEQTKVYQAYRNKYRDYLMKKIDEDGIGKAKLFVLEGLLKLRQICDSPELLSDEENYGSQSVKIKELLRHIETKTGKHKILIFSQFVGMLKLIERSLLENQIKFEYLDGKCSKDQRQQSVENFQNNSEIRVFLISLKAGGLGLNLTAADYVYIVDPWWNPAVENQAIDRCYRIGQDKKVFAYRMICKDTVEEKIVKLQDSKREIAENIIQTDESILKKINREQIIDLFS